MVEQSCNRAVLGDDVGADRKPLPNLSPTPPAEFSREDLEDEMPGFQDFTESPLTHSNRRPRPYHADPLATGGEPRQRFSLVLAASAPCRLAPGCHRLRPRGSIKAPYSVVRSGYNVVAVAPKTT